VFYFWEKSVEFYRMDFNLGKMCLECKMILLASVRIV